MAFANEALHILAAAALGTRELFRQQPPVNDIQFGLRLCRRNSRPKPSRDQQPACKWLGPSFAIGLQAIQSMERHPNIRAASNHNPGELRRSDADHRERNLVDGDRSTDDGKIAPETVAPVAIAQDGY